MNGGNPVHHVQTYPPQPHYGKLPNPYGNEYQGPNGPHYPVNPAYGSNYVPMPVPYGVKLDSKLDGAPGGHGPEKGHEQGAYKHWEQPPDGLAHDSQGMPSRPSSAQEKHRSTPDRRTPGRSPGLSEPPHPHGPLHLSGPNGMQAMPPSMTPVPFPGSHLYGQHPPPLPMYGMGAPPPYMASNSQPPNMPFNAGYPVDPAKKMRLGEPDGLRSGPPPPLMEPSFQVPSSVSRHPFNGSMPPGSTQLAPHNVAQAAPMRVPHMGEHWEQPSHPNSNLMANAPPPPSTPTSGHSASKSPTSESDKSSKKKRKRCGNCPGCLRKDNCGDCGPCKSVRSHQICKMRKCDQLKSKKEKVREVSTRLGCFSRIFVLHSFRLHLPSPSPPARTC